MIEAAESSELRELPLFHGVGSEALRTANELVRRTTVPAGRVLVGAGSRSEAIYFILAGSVRVQGLGDNGSEVTLALLGPGDVVGQMSLVPRSGRSAWVIARQETTLLWMERRGFLRLLEASPQLARNLVDDLTARLQSANERLLALATLDVAGRVARLVLELAERYGRPARGPGVLIELAVTQGEVAEMIAATRERVNQIMVRFKRSGVLSIDGEGRITVQRSDVLAGLSGS